MATGDPKAGHLHVHRLQNGAPSTYPRRRPELPILRQLRRDSPDGPYVFSAERRGPVTDGNVRHLVARAGVADKLGFPVHPPMLSHSCGVKLANDGHDTRAVRHDRGHKNIEHSPR